MFEEYQKTRSQVMQS